MQGLSIKNWLQRWTENLFFRDFMYKKNRKLVVFVSNLFFWMSLKIRWRRKIFLTYLSTLLLELSWINFYHVVVKRPFSTRNLLESKNWSEIWSLHAKVLRSIITLNLPKARPNCTCLRILLFNLNQKKIASNEISFYESQFDYIKTKQFSNF